MTEQEIRIGMRARWVDPIKTDNEPVGEIDGITIKHPRSPEHREIWGHLRFDKPLWNRPSEQASNVLNAALLQLNVPQTRALWAPLAALEIVEVSP